MLKKLRYIFNKKDKRRIAFIFFVILLGSLFETLGVSALLPFIEVMMDTSMIQGQAYLRVVYNFFGFTNAEQFLLAIGIMICIVYVLKNIYLTFEQNTILKFSYGTRMRLATRLLTTYMAEPYTFHLNKNVSELQRSLQYDTNQFMLLVNSFLQLLAEFAVVACLGAYLFYTSPTISIILLGLLALTVGFFFLISKKVSRKLGQQNEAYNAQLLQWINQSLGGIKEVKVLNREDFFIDSYKKVYKKLIKGAKNNELLAAIPKYIIESVCIVGIVVAVLVKLFFGQRHLNAFVLQISAFAVASFRLLPSIGKINAYFNNIMYCAPALDLIYQDLKEIENFEPEEKSKENVGGMRFEEEIRLEDVTYHYPDSDVKILDHVNMSIEKGQTVALIGSSGAGKTTAADVILGLLKPQGGKILVDGFDIYEDMDAWHHMLGYIPQSIYLSDDTIRNNIAFGVYEEDIQEDAIVEALKKAQLYEFVMGLEKGLDTFVGDRGVRLSGGQRQRIGIARALYYNPEILVLDEATSALDNETEEAVMEAIDNLHGQKTMIIIAHRLTTIKQADVIFRIENGKAIVCNKEEVLENA